MIRALSAAALLVVSRLLYCKAPTVHFLCRASNSSSMAPSPTRESMRPCSTSARSSSSWPSSICCTRLTGASAIQLRATICTCWWSGSAAPVSCPCPCSSSCSRLLSHCTRFCPFCPVSQTSGRAPDPFLHQHSEYYCVKFLQTADCCRFLPSETAAAAWRESLSLWNIQGGRSADIAAALAARRSARAPVLAAAMAAVKVRCFVTCDV
jgi:hypothetical protein